MMGTLVEIKNLTKHFPVEKGILSKIINIFSKTETKVVHAVCNVSLDIIEGETLGLVGESGSGKSTIGRCILRLMEPTSGVVKFNGEEITSMKKGKLRTIRRQMQIIFQDPFSSLNPRATIKQIVGRPLNIHSITQSSKATNDKVSSLLKDVGLTEEHANRYPHQFSGGQKQRISVARAIAMNPKFVVADEPVSALDVSIQVQILNLLKSLREKYDLTYLFISHDLSVVRHICDRVAVMYLGQIVEIGNVNDVFSAPAHPYTQALISAIPIPDPKLKTDKIILKGDIPSALNPPQGCRFNTRCPYVMDVCKEVDPEITDLGKNHYAACHLLTKDSKESD